MWPVRVKYCGMFWLTQRTYLTFQVIALILCLAMIVTGLTVIIPTGKIWPHLPDRDKGDALLQLQIALFWAGLLGLLYESIETMVMLRKFRRARAERQARQEIVDSGTLEAPALGSKIRHTSPDESPNPNVQP